MDNITREIRRVQEALRCGRISKLDLARHSGIRDTTLIGCMDADWNPTAKTLRSLSKALDGLGFFTGPESAGGRVAA